MTRREPDEINSADEKLTAAQTLGQAKVRQRSGAAGKGVRNLFD